MNFFFEGFRSTLIKGGVLGILQITSAKRCPLLPVIPFLHSEYKYFSPIWLSPCTLCTARPRAEPLEQIVFWVQPPLCACDPQTCLREGCHRLGRWALTRVPRPISWTVAPISSGVWASFPHKGSECVCFGSLFGTKIVFSPQR